MYVFNQRTNFMIPLNEVANCRIFFDSLGALFLLASSILPGNRESVEEILLKAYGRWHQRPEKEWTLLNAQRDVAVEALQRAASQPQELILSQEAPSELPVETVSVLALPLLERIVFLMGTVCRFGIDEMSKFLRLPIADIRSARINAFRLLPKTVSVQQQRTA
jgi:hypothetical protein